MQQLVGKSALITAGASGIGRVMAMRFADEGARVHVCDVSEAALASFRAERPEIAGTSADVTDPAVNERLVDTAVAEFDGQFHCRRAAVPHLRKAGGGSIVNMSSSAGRLGYPMRTPHAAAKWAVVGFIQSLAMELGFRYSLQPWLRHWPTAIAQKGRWLLDDPRPA